jgi:protein-tyrosine phosphatase
MDNDNLASLKQHCPPQHSHKLALLMHYCQTPSQDEITDPYYGGNKGFENVLDMVETASQGLLQHIIRK